MNNKILIFGSNGLVGSATVALLKKSDYFVVASNRLDTNLFNIEEVNKKIHTESPDIIINAAAKVGGIVANNTYRSQFLIDNLKINMNILESCIPHPNIKIINLGSSCIYPLNAKNPISEDSFMDGKLEKTNSPYAMAKLSAIELGRALNIQYGHKVTNLMPTNLYGPNDNFHKEDSHVIPGLIARMHEAKLKKLPHFNIWGSGNPKREFLFVDDLSNSIKFIIENNIDEDLMNIGSGEEISINKLAKKIKSIIKYEGELQFDSTKPDGNPRKLLNSAKIFDYGWKPLVDLESGLKKTYNWYLKNY
ncbi:MAG: GDP-fucose synthetase [Gammaproteobacteria bacterium]|nr:GDP-fucose synthetase [Gammaproteobacteria bacterium]|tara:strand:- start:2053 stop:2970 length:918 start_codon:yes stop_codon:yes gene_type:complete